MAMPLPRVPNPSVAITKEPPSRDWLLFFLDLIAALLNRVAVTGSVTFAAATTAAVTFATAEADANYDVWFASGADNYFWTTSKTTAGFVANAKTSNSATVRYQLIRA